MTTAVKDEKAMCWIMAVCICVCVYVLITCCYQRLVNQPRVCIFPADWPQSVSPLPAPWLAAQTGAPANKRIEKNGTEGQEYILIRESFMHFY